MEPKKRQLLTDSLEFIIVLALVLMVLTIYVPKALWEVEDSIKQESQFRMRNVYQVENFFRQLTGNFTPDSRWALTVVNAVRDSLTADSTFLHNQKVKLDSKIVDVQVPKGFNVEYDTTFGFLKSRRDTINDIIVTILNRSEDDPARLDTAYFQKKNLPAAQQQPNFVRVLEEATVQRVEKVSYYDSYMPDTVTLVCPKIRQPYLIEITDDEIITVSSPIETPIKERKYLIFSLVVENHGSIKDGLPSWEM